MAALSCSHSLIPTATVIYALAMVSHAMEWALGRARVANTTVVQEQVLVTSGDSPIIDALVDAAEAGRHALECATLKLPKPASAGKDHVAHAVQNHQRHGSSK